MKWARNTQGFTITELIIVIVIIAILSAITIVGYNGVRNNANSASVAAGVKQAEDVIKLWMAKNSGRTPTSLTQAGLKSINNNVYLSYTPYDNNTNYCITGMRYPNPNGSKSYFKVSWRNDGVAEGNCGVESIAGGSMLALNETQSASGSTVSFPAITGSPDIILYGAFFVYNTDTAWSAMAGLGSTNGSTMQLDLGGAGSTALRYRIDTNAFTNASASQNVRTPGFHRGWLQLSENMTVAEMAYDQAEVFNTRTLAEGSNVAFNTVRLGGNNASQFPVAAVAFNTTHDEKTRARVLQYLASYE